MRTYIAKRILLSIPVVFGVAFIVFAMVRAIPGDPAQVIGGQAATPEYIAALRKDLGLDRPVVVQFGGYLSSIARGDFGRSIRSNAPVTEELWARLPNTFQLTMASMVVATVVGVGAGIVSAIRPYSLLDAAVMVFALAGLSMPIFWSGLMMMLVFSIILGWFPPVGTGSLAHLVLPSVTLGMTSAAIIARMTRSSMLEVLRADYVRTARAKGQVERLVVGRHAFKNALIPVITVIGLQTGTLLSGAVLTESVFAWPGVGRLLVEGILTRDYPVVQGSVMVVALVFVFVNLAVDVLYALVDPRIHYQ